MITFPLKVRSYQLGTINTIQQFEADGSWIMSSIEFVEGRKWSLRIKLPPLTLDQQRKYSAFQGQLRGSMLPFKFVLPKVKIPTATASACNIDTVTFSDVGNLVVGDLFTMNGQLLKITEMSGSAATVFPYVHDITSHSVDNTEVYGMFRMLPDDYNRAVLSVEKLSITGKEIELYAEEAT